MRPVSEARGTGNSSRYKIIVNPTKVGISESASVWNFIGDLVETNYGRSYFRRIRLVNVKHTIHFGRGCCGECSEEPRSLSAVCCRSVFSGFEKLPPKFYVEVRGKRVQLQRRSSR